MTTTTRTYRSQGTAENVMRHRNRSRGPKVELTVLVDGPDNGQYTLMSLRQAAENGFAYRWAC